MTALSSFSALINRGLAAIAGLALVLPQQLRLRDDGPPPALPALLALRQHPAIEDAETVMTVVEPTGVVTLQGLNEASPPRMMGAILLVGAVVGLLWLSGD